MPSAHPALLLVSASPARRSTWRAARVEALAHVSSVDEDSVVTAAEARHEALGAADVALLLARAKAEDVVAALEAEEGDPLLAKSPKAFRERVLEHAAGRCGVPDHGCS